MTAEKFFTSKMGVISAALFATFLWGSAFPAIKLSYIELSIGANEYDKQLLFAGYRFLLAGVFIFIFFTLFNQSLKLRRATLVPLIQLGFVQTFIQYLLFYIGLSYSTGMQGAVIAGTASFFQIIFAHFLYADDGLSLRKWIGIALGFGGVLVVNLPKVGADFQFGIGELLLLIAMMASAYGNIMARERSSKMDISYLTAYQMLFGSIGLIIAGGWSAGFFPFTFDWYTVGLIMYLAFLSAAGFVLWNNVMKYNKVGKVSMYLFLVPVFGVVLSAAFLDEVMHYTILIGLALVTVGIIIVNRQKVNKKEEKLQPTG
ncbi:DMT family transporter [Sutcliffiella halmapala]|uniref:DMT family transporter n=1 Tax=Sutcliffiella halmapala TaxID=79882 RepID=UPI0011168DC7|nr:DMT family transporter [Sutcliffiella halmapala]